MQFAPSAAVPGVLQIQEIDHNPLAAGGVEGSIAPLRLNRGVLPQFGPFTEVVEGQESVPGRLTITRATAGSFGCWERPWPLEEKT